jgi:quercetin dioxygenase-like cupin family protein
MSPEAMEFLAPETFKQLSNPGITSTQLLSPQNSTSTRVTITSVTVAPGAEQPRHKHDSSEQIWIALEGSGMLLLKDEATQEFRQGQVARFEDGEIHGFKNTSEALFKYLSITSPPINFTYAYASEA